MKIVVLAGGLSSERDVSLVSGRGICQALQERGHQAVLLDVFLGHEGTLDFEHLFAPNPGGQSGGGAGTYDLMGEIAIQSVNPDIEEVRAMRQDNDGLFGPNVVEICRRADIVYLGLHGAEGENGKVQAAFDVLGIQYTGSGYLGSALAMDKGMAKKLFRHAGIPTPRGFSVTRATENKENEVGYPCVVKPCCGGSSVGVSIAENEEGYRLALETGFHYEEELLVEECIRGREFSVGVIDGKSLPVIEIIPKEGFYDYKTKYQPGMAADVCPAELSKELTAKMQQYAIEVFRELKLEVYARVDFLLDKDNNMYCLEANTLPGMTATSLLPQEAKVVGVDYGELCEQIIGLSMRKYRKAATNKVSGNDASHSNPSGKALPARYSVADMVPVWTSPMQGMTLARITKACGGTYYGPEGLKETEVAMITIDSRQVEQGCLFVAIKGERVDGNTFVEAAYRDGAACCMSEKAPENSDMPYIVVESCYQALKDMAELYRGMADATIIGITGSVGKTTTKEMVASVLSERFHILKTKGNFNNEVGVPLTLFRLRREHEVAVVEMGISDFGEMTRLSKMVRPHSCIITNVGECHLESLGDRDGVLKAKTEIFRYMDSCGTAYLNGDDDKLSTVVFRDGKVAASYGEGEAADFMERNEEDKRQIRYFCMLPMADAGSASSVDSKRDIYAENIVNLGLKGTRFTVVAGDRSFGLEVPVPGEHMVRNALAAVSVALDMGMAPEEIKRGIAKFRPVGGHGSIVETESFTILDDCYNANPASMEAGINVLKDALGRRVAIIGDMFELGENERELHRKVGEYAAAAGLDMLVCIGKLAGETYQGASVMGDKAHHFATKEEAMAVLPSLLQKGDAILVKASHGMCFEKIVAQLKEM